MAEGSNIGNLFYTVSVDRASLEKVRKDLRQLGEAASKAAPGVKKTEQAMESLRGATERVTSTTKESSSRFDSLVEDLRVLQASTQDTVNRWRAGKISLEQFTEEMTVFGQLADGIRSDLEALGSSTEGASIDQVKLSRALRDTSSVMDTVRDKTEKLGVEYDDVETRFETLSARAQELRRDLSTVISRKDITEPEQYSQALMEIDTRAEALNGELDELRSTMGRTAEGAAKVSGRTSELAQTQAKARREINSTNAAMSKNESEADELGAAYRELLALSSSYSAEARALASALDTSSGNTQQNRDALSELMSVLRVIAIELDEYSSRVHQASTAKMELSKESIKLNSALRKSEKSLEKNTGALSKQAMTANLSYGGLSLLQDRIFQISPALGIFTNQLMFTERGLKAMLATMAPVLAVAGSLIAVFGTLAASVRAGSALETALADVRKTTNLSSEALYGLTQNFQIISREIPIAVSELLDMAKVAGQLGITGAENVERFADTVARLSIATDVTGEQGATNLARFLQATGTSMDDMGTEAERVANVLNQLENTTASTAAEILQMTSYTQGLSSQAGLTTDEILALNAALLSLGVKAEAGGSAVVRTMAKIQEAASSGSSELAAFAENADMTVEEFQALVDNAPLDALVALADGMSATAESGGNLNDVLNELNINEVRERRTLLALAQGNETLTAAIEEARRESFLMNSLNKEVQIQSETLASQVQILKNRFIELAQDIGQRTVPVIKELNEFLLNLMDTIEALMPLIVGLSVAAGTRLAISLGSALLRPIGKVITAVSTLGPVLVKGATAAYNIGRAFGALRIVLAPLGGPAGIIAAVAGTAALLFTTFRNGKSDVDETTAALDDYRESVELAASEFSRVRDRQDLEWAVDSITATLEGEAKTAWEDYTAEVLKAVEEGDNLNDVMDQFLDKLKEINSQELRTDIISGLADAAVEVQNNISEIPGLLEEVSFEGFSVGEDGTVFSSIEDAQSALARLEQQLESLRSPQGVSPLGGETDIVSSEETRAVARAIEALREFISLREELNNLRSAEAAVDDSLGGGGDDDGVVTDTGSGAGGGGAAGREFDPLGDILERREDQIDELEILYGKYGRMAGLAYAQGLVDTNEEAANAFVDFISTSADRSLELVDGEWVEKLVPKDELIQQIQEAGGTNEAGEYLISTAEATEKAMQMLSDASDNAANYFSIFDIRVSDLAAGIDDYLVEGLADVEGAFEEGIIDPVGRAERRVDYHRRLFNTLSSEYGEFSDAAQIVAARLAEEEATLNELTQAENRRVESQREASRQQSAIDEAVSNRIVGEIALESQLSKNNITQTEYYERLIELKQAELEARQAKDGMTQETIELEAEIINLNEALDEEVDRQEELRQAMDDTAAARQRSVEVTRDYHTELSRGASVGMDVAMARGEQLATQMDLQELLDFGVITQEEYNARLLQSKKRLLEYAVQMGVTAQWVIQLKQEVRQLEAETANYNETAQESNGILDMLSSGFRKLASAASDAGNDGVASFLNFAGELTNQIPNIQEGFTSITEGFDEFDSEAGVTAESNEKAVGKITAGIASIGTAMGAMLPSYDSAANQMVEGAFSVAGAIAEIAIPIPGVGKIIGSLGPIVSGVLGDMGNGAKQVTEDLNKMADNLQYVTRATAQSFRDIEGMTERVSRGGILGWLGATKEAINEEVMSIVQNIAEGISNGLGDALTAGVTAAITGEGDWKKAFRDSLEDAMLNLIIESLVNSAILAEDGPFQEFIAEFTRIMAEEGPAAALAYANQEMPGLLDETNQMLEDSAESMPDMFKIGSDAVIENTQDNIDRLTEHIQDSYSYLGDAATKMLIQAATTGDEINQEMLNNMLNMADSIMSGIQGAMKKGMRSAMAGDQDWKKELKSGVLSAIGDTVLDAFIKQAIIQKIMAGFVADFVALWEEGDYEAANEYIKNNLDSTINQVADVIDTFINAIPPELRGDLFGEDEEPTPSRPSPEPEEPTSGPRDAGTRIGEITGPTRDLLLDLLRPLSILPSWTSMIRDIRNDVRAIAASGGISITPDTITTPESVGTITNVENQTINITNPTITTQARSIKELYRELSEYASKQKKGGKR